MGQNPTFFVKKESDRTVFENQDRTIMQASEQVLEEIREITDIILKKEGVELVGLELKPLKTGCLLRFLVDRQGGITLQECSQINRQISQILDEGNLIDTRYILEVSSPGVDRNLKTRTDFWLNIGRRIRVVVSEPVEGQKTYMGLLKSVGPQEIIMETDFGQDVNILLDNIIKARQEVRI